MSLTELSAREMVQRLARREVSSVELLDAHLARIDALDGPLRAIVHRDDAAARAAAQAADRALAAGRGRPLEGLPITIKESIATAGVPVTLGVRARQGRVAAEDAAIVTAMRDLGAIPFAKTNVSQLLLFHESSNPIWGATGNPWDLARVPGGSSGGEAAAVAAGLSPLGIGTDIGGSIRIPAAFTGTAGLKPTLDRWPMRGVVGALAGQEVVRGQCGPMARSAHDLALVWGALDPTRLAALDPGVPPLPMAIRDAEDLRGLRVGVAEDDGFLAPAASVRRAVREAAGHLERRGATLVPYVPPRLDEVIDTYFAALSSDGGATIEGHLAGDTIAPQLSALRSVAKLPGPVRRAAAALMSARGEHRVARVLRAVRERSVAELWQLAVRRTELRWATLVAWDAAGLDGVLCPAHATCALRHGDSVDFTLGGMPSLLYNFLNFPAGVVPVTRVRADEQVRADPHDRIERRAVQVEAGSAGLPLGVQLVGRPWREDVVLALMVAVEDEARRGETFPHTPVAPIPA